MAFDASVITSIAPPVYHGSSVLISWTSSASAGTWYQVYVAGVLVDSTQATTCTIASPRGMHDIRIGAVASGERTTDFSSSFTLLSNRATLTWDGGAFQGQNLLGFRIYGGPYPGASPSYTKPLATILAYEQGDDSEGFGFGQFGGGGFGDVNTFTWTSVPLAAGIWHFAIVPYTAAGNEGTGTVVSVTIVSPPRPPARNSKGKRLVYSYAGGKITLNWLASPS